jgi:hypothetical protein
MCTTAGVYEFVENDTHARPRALCVSLIAATLTTRVAMLATDAYTLPWHVWGSLCGLLLFVPLVDFVGDLACTDTREAATRRARMVCLLLVSGTVAVCVLVVASSHDSVLRMRRGHWVVLELALFVYAGTDAAAYGWERVRAPPPSSAKENGDDPARTLVA